MNGGSKLVALWGHKHIALGHQKHEKGSSD